jgi:hypothetical protein
MHTWGVLGARDVLPVLSANGRLDVAYALATQRYLFLVAAAR